MDFSNSTPSPNPPIDSPKETCEYYLNLSDGISKEKFYNYKFNII